MPLAMSVLLVTFTEATSWWRGQKTKLPWRWTRHTHVMPPAQIGPKLFQRCFEILVKNTHKSVLGLSVHHHNNWTQHCTPKSSFQILLLYLKQIILSRLLHLMSLVSESNNTDRSWALHLKGQRFTPQSDSRIPPGEWLSVSSRLTLTSILGFTATLCRLNGLIRPQLQKKIHTAENWAISVVPNTVQDATGDPDQTCGKMSEEPRQCFHTMMRMQPSAQQCWQVMPVIFCQVIITEWYLGEARPK